MFCLFKKRPHSKEYQSKYKCSKCGNRHHVTICSKTPVSDTPTDTHSMDKNVHLTTTPSQVPVNNLNSYATHLKLLPLCLCTFTPTRLYYYRLPTLAYIMSTCQSFQWKSSSVGCRKPKVLHYGTSEESFEAQT